MKMQSQGSLQRVPVAKIFQSYMKNKSLVNHTPLQRSEYLSKKYGADVWIKREDLQAVRSFKIRGAANAFWQLTEEERKRGVVTASAGNHAQGIAYCCNKFKVKGTIFMPKVTPLLKINRVKHYGGQWLEVVLYGDTFDDSAAQALSFQARTEAVFIHPFNDLNVIEGQGGVAVEIFEDWKQESLDYIFVCCGGGGLLSGVGSYIQQMNPETKVIGFEPSGSPSMYQSLKENQPVTLKELETFVDGASIKKTSALTFEIIKSLRIPIWLIPEGLTSKTMLEISNKLSIILEPAGSLSISGLELMKEEIKGKTVVCILSGANNDISRLPEIKLRCRLYEEKQAYYTITTKKSNLREMLQQLVNPEKEEIILIDNSKKYKVLSIGCVIGLSFFEPSNKKTFEQRMESEVYQFKQLTPRDPILRRILSI